MIFSSQIPWKNLYITISGKKNMIESIWFDHEKKNISENKLTRMAAMQIEEYLNGTRTKFDLPYEIQGSEFKKKVLSQTVLIPYGQTSYYSEIARAIGNSKACRAVGGALKVNQLPIIIPCHRILGKNSMGGFASGTYIKKELLKIEGILLS